MADEIEIPLDLESDYVEKKVHAPEEKYIPYKDACETVDIILRAWKNRGKGPFDPGQLESQELVMLEQVMPSVAVGISSRENMETSIDILESVTFALDSSARYPGDDEFSGTRNMITQMYIRNIGNMPWPEILADEELGRKADKLLKTVIGEPNAAPAVHKVFSLSKNADLLLELPLHESDSFMFRFYERFLVSLPDQERIVFIEKLSQKYAEKKMVSDMFYFRLLGKIFPDESYESPSMERFDLLIGVVKAVHGVDITPILKDLQATIPAEARGKAVRDARSMLLLLEKLKDSKDMLKLYNEYGIVHFARYPLNILKKQAERKELDSSKGRVVAVFPGYDYNGAFHNLATTELLTNIDRASNGENEITIYETNTVRGLIGILRHIHQGKIPLKYLILGGHGQNKEVTLGKDLGKGILKIGDIIRAIPILRGLRIFSRDTTVILDSCSTAEEKELDDGTMDMQNVAQAISEIGVKAVAPNKKTTGTVFEEGNENPFSFINADTVVYQDGEKVA